MCLTPSYFTSPCNWVHGCQPFLELEVSGTVLPWMLCLPHPAALSRHARSPLILLSVCTSSSPVPDGRDGQSYSAFFQGYTTQKGYQSSEWRKQPKGMLEKAGTLGQRAGSASGERWIRQPQLIPALNWPRKTESDLINLFSVFKQIPATSTNYFCWKTWFLHSHKLILWIIGGTCWIFMHPAQTAMRTSLDHEFWTSV